MAISETARLIASLELKDLFTKQVDNATKSLGGLDKKLDQTQSRSYRAGQQIGHGIQNAAKLIAAAAISAATISAGVFTLAIKKASDLEETVNKVGVVFKDQAAGVLAFGKDAATSFGLSEQAALEAAASFGNLFVSMGLTSKTSATMSEAMVKLAGDLASFNNIDPAEALDKLRSGLTGQFRPLKELGINIDQTLLKAEALKIGLVKSTVPAAQVQLAVLKVKDATVKLTEAQRKYGAGSEQVLKATVAQQKAQDALSKLISKVPSNLTPAQKAQAAYALILEQSKTAQGDYGRTSKGLANEIRTLKGNWDDLLATLGTAALPGVAKIFDRINVAIKANQPAVAKLGDAIAGLFSDANINEGAAFIENALKTAMAAAPILVEAGKATLFFIQQAVGIFNSLPDPLKAIVVGGFALNKLTGGLVTNVAGGIAGSILGVLKGSRGASPANPVFVSDISGGLGGAGGGPAGKFGDIIKSISLAALIPVVAVAVSETLKTLLPGNPLTGPQPILNGPLPSKPIIDLGSLHLPFFGGPSSPPVKVTLVDHTGSPLLDRGGRESGVRAPIFLPGDTRSEGRAQGPASVQSVLTRAISLLMAQGGLQKAFILSLHGEFRDAFKLLAKANSAQQIKDAIKAINKITFAKGIGGSGGAAATEKTLKGLLTKFPSLASILVPEIRKVHAKMLGRQFEESEFRKFDRINKSNLDNGKKVAELQKIAKDVGAKDRANGARLQAKVDALKATVASQLAATRKTIAANDPRIYLTIPVENRVVVNARQVQATAAIFSRVFGGTRSSPYAKPGG